MGGQIRRENWVETSVETHLVQTTASVKAVRAALCRGVPDFAGVGGEAETWLILPVVICLSQRLSHACVCLHFYIIKLRNAH